MKSLYYIGNRNTTCILHAISYNFFRKVFNIIIISRILKRSISYMIVDLTLIFMNSTLYAV